MSKRQAMLLLKALQRSLHMRIAAAESNKEREELGDMSAALSVAIAELADKAAAEEIKEMLNRKGE